MLARLSDCASICPPGFWVPQHSLPGSTVEHKTRQDQIAYLRMGCLPLPTPEQPTASGGTIPATILEFNYDTKPGRRVATAELEGIAATGCQPPNNRYKQKCCFQTNRPDARRNAGKLGEVLGMFRLHQPIPPREIQAEVVTGMGVMQIVMGDACQPAENRAAFLIGWKDLDPAVTHCIAQHHMGYKNEQRQWMRREENQYQRQVDRVYHSLTDIEAIGGEGRRLV